MAALNNDWLTGGGGADWLDGSAGFDGISYADSSAGITLALDGLWDGQLFRYFGMGTGGDAQGDRVYGVEKVQGSMFDDVITGAFEASELIGMDGNDKLIGRNGDDTIRGGVGNDTMFGSFGNDVIKGDDGADRLTGNEGNDALTGGAGADVFVFATGSRVSEMDTITDFEDGLDRLRFAAADKDHVTAVDVAGGTELHLALADGDFIVFVQNATGAQVMDQLVFA
ncbi:MAG: hypothetical protein HZT43_13050 [Exiguobacterium profundum]|nr:MAG: hypothetical protein HZT43_13050 [Exiguobacterium profundum]